MALAHFHKGGKTLFLQVYLVHLAKFHNSGLLYPFSFLAGIPTINGMGKGGPVYKNDTGILKICL